MAERVNPSPLPDRLGESGDWLVQAIDPQARLARLICMDALAYRDASFLDDRILPAGKPSLLCKLDDLIVRASEVSSPPAGWIFHIGHVGSTLVSRLLGEFEGVLAIREPRSLRDLTATSGEEQRRLATALRRLMARRGANDRTVVVKATSFVSEVAPLLVEARAPVLFLYATPENYIASILAGENSLKELAALQSFRTDRLLGRGIALDGFDGSNAHRAAAAWACEMTSLEAAAVGMPHGEIRWADFDAILVDMAGWLDQAAGHFGIEPAPGVAGAIAAGPLMRRYSKALEYDYSPGLRAELLAEARYRHGADIEAAISALADVGRSSPLVAQALQRAERE
jgi:hypothetical protein